MSVHAKSKKRARRDRDAAPMPRFPTTRNSSRPRFAVHADVLITKDRALLDLARRVPFASHAKGFAELNANADQP